MMYKALPISMLLAGAGILAAAERPVKMTDLPPAVRQAVQRETAGATIRGLSKETENGKTCYEAETIVNGRSRDILFDASGTVTEIEEQVSLESIPAPARSAIEQYAAGGRVLGVEAVTSGNTTAYEARVQKTGKRSEVKVSADGKLLNAAAH